jgi:hypothetical protein
MYLGVCGDPEKKRTVKITNLEAALVRGDHCDCASLIDDVIMNEIEAPHRQVISSHNKIRIKSEFNKFTFTSCEHAG